MCSAVNDPPCVSPRDSMRSRRRFSRDTSDRGLFACFFDILRQQMPPTGLMPITGLAAMLRRAVHA
eukprot:scaffold7092_cov262-Pinguiococcus_pyrenoidosus.AAC.17